MLKTILTSVAFFAAGALAQTPPITITQPLTGFNWTTCQSQIIAWTNPVQDTITQIYLDQGPSTQLQKVALIASNVPTAPMKYEWTPPSTIASGQYSLEFGTAPNLAYAGPFTITNSGATCGPASGSQAPPPPNSGSSSQSASSVARSGSSSAASSASAAASSASAAAPSSASPVASSAASAATPASAASASASATPNSSSTVRPSSVNSMALVAMLSLIFALAALF